MTAGLQRVVGNPKDEALARAANASGPHAEPASSAPQFAPIRAPWHVRHSRAVIAGVTLAGLAAVAYAAFQLWQIFADPLSGIAVREVAAPIRVEAVPAPVRANPAPVPAVPAPAPKVAMKARPPERRPVTHTLREESQAAVAAAPPAASTAALGDACPEGVVALGLCPAGKGKDK